MPPITRTEAPGCRLSLQAALAAGNHLAIASSANVLRPAAGVGVALVLLACAACDQREPPRPPFDPDSHGLMSPLGDGDTDAAVPVSPSGVRDGDAAVPGDSCAPVATPGARDQEAVIINEVFAGSLIDDADDWFELHNAGRVAIVLDGWTVEDFFTGDAPKPTSGHFELPAGTVLCPGRFLVVRRGSACEALAATFEFGIGSTDRLMLFDASGGVIDDAEWTELPPGQSMGRVDDDLQGAFRRLERPSPMVSNSAECVCCGECLIGACVERDGSCVVEDEQACQGSEACLQLGWCGLQDGRCMALLDEHCAASEVCRRRGRCGPRDGECEVVADADCRASKLCENEGRCSADLDAGACIATSQQDCEASDDCVHLNEDGDVESRKSRCTLRDERCVATSCVGTSVCEETMCCDLVDGKCVRL